MTDEYNGWTNRETWAVVLHIDSDEGLHDYRNGLCQMFVTASKEPTATGSRSACLTDEQAARMWLSNGLEKWVTKLSYDVYFPDADHEPADRERCGMFSDIGSLWRVNWDEIATNWLQDFEAAA